MAIGVMFWAAFTSLCRHFLMMVEQLLHQAGMQPVQSPPVAVAEYVEVPLQSPQSAEQEDLLSCCFSDSV